MGSVDVPVMDFGARSGKIRFKDEIPYTYVLQFTTERIACVKESLQISRA